MTRYLAIVLAAVAAPCALAEGDWHLEDERWYEVELAGGRAGWLQETVWSSDDRYRRSTRTQLSISRGPIEMTIEIRSTIVESADGQPIMMRLVQDMGIQSVDTEWIFEADNIVERSRQGDRMVERDRPLPEAGWLTPMAIQRRFVEARRAGVRVLEFKTLDPQNGLTPVTTTMTLVGDGSYMIGGRAVPVTNWNATTDLIALVAQEKYTADGTIVYQAVDMPFGTMVTRLSTKRRALAADGKKAPELLVATFVKPDRPFPNAQNATTAKLRLRVTKGEMPAIPSAGAQRAELTADGTGAIVRVDLSLNGRADDVNRDEYMDRTATADTEDPEILALVAKARKSAGKDPLERADAMRALVNRTVSAKNLDTAFGTASETARTLSGDCSEHAVLLCAMLRADNIPARVAIGLIYADRFLGEKGIFGWHMWTQALIDGRWVDLDATLPKRYHAGHVLTGTTALSDGGLGAELASTVMLLGNLEIEVLDVGYE